MTNELEKVAIFKMFRRGAKAGGGAKKPPTFRSSGNRADAYKSADPSNVKFNNQKQMNKNHFEQQKKQGFGMLGNAALWGVGKVPKFGKGWKDVARENLTKFKINAKEMDANIAGKVKDSLGVKRGGAIDKFTSRKHKVQVGTEMRNGVETPIFRDSDRVDSLTAPFANTMKKATPLVGSFVIGDKAWDQGMKMMGADDGTGTEQTPPPEYIQQQQFAQNPNYNYANGAEQLAYRMEEGLLKEAAISKIATLEDEVSKLNTIVKIAKHEREVLMNDSLHYQDELDHYKEAYEKATDELEKVSMKYQETVNDIEKEAKRKEVEKVAEKLLERGIIKQAELNEYRDFLEKSDEFVLEAFTKVANSAVNGELGNLFDIEKSAKELPLPSSETIGKISSTGQTMAEAVSDLLK